MSDDDNKWWLKSRNKSNLVSIEGGKKTLRDQAIDLAKKGFAVFPLRIADKKPLPGTNGLKDASNDPKVVEGRWSHTDYNIGIPTGTANGFFAVDIDDEDSWADLLTQHDFDIPAAPTIKTGNGRHMLFAMPPGGVEIRNSASKVGPGIDVRGTGGYIVGVGSVHPTGATYAWEGQDWGDLNPPQAPTWLLELMLKPKEVQAAPVAMQPITQTVDLPGGTDQHGLTAKSKREYALGAISAACGVIAGTREGSRNQTLNDNGFPLYRFLTDGTLTEQEIDNALIQAAQSTGLGLKEIRTTLGSMKSKCPLPAQDWSVVAEARQEYFDSQKSDLDLTAVKALVERVRSEKTGTTEAGQVDDPAEQPEAEEPTGLKFISGAQAAAEAKAADYLIKNFLERDAHGILVAASQSFKSFFTIKIAHSIATGQPLFGHKVYQTGTVVMVCGEGMGGIRRRIRAAEMAYGCSFGERLQVLDGRININDKEQMQQLAISIARFDPALIIYDTFSSLAHGVEENSNSEVSTLLADIRGISEAVGASTVIVHHLGKDASKGVRGASAFKGNVDFEWAMARRTKDDGNGLSMVAKVSCGKMKDAECWESFEVEATKINLGIFNQDQEEETSLALDGIDAAEMTSELLKNAKEKTAVEVAAKAYQILYHEQRRNLEQAGGDVTSFAVLTEDWMKKMAETIDNENTIRSAKRKVLGEDPRFKRPPLFRIQGRHVYHIHDNFCVNRGAL